MLPLQGGSIVLLQDVEGTRRRADEAVRVASWGSGSSKTRRSWGQQGEDARRQDNLEWMAARGAAGNVVGLDGRRSSMVL